MHSENNLEQQEKEKIEEGKNPGLGIREIHSQLGITGAGIHVAIIDQHLVPSHQEFKDRIISYTEIDPPINEELNSMHANAVTSLLGGTTCGTAPETLIHSYAGKGGSLERIITGLNLILEKNKTIPRQEQVKIVSISKGIAKDNPLAEEAKTTIQKARETGLFVFYVENEIPLMIGGSNTDKEDPNTYERGLIYNDIPKEELKDLSTSILIPTDYRTYASYKNPNEYIYKEKGGFSWAIPYLAGIAALAIEKQPNLTQTKFLQLVMNTATKSNKGFNVINPKGIIASL